MNEDTKQCLICAIAATIILCTFMGGCVKGCSNGAFGNLEDKAVHYGYSQQVVTITNVSSQIIWTKTKE